MAAVILELNGYIFKVKYMASSIFFYFLFSPSISCFTLFYLSFFM